MSKHNGGAEAFPRLSALLREHDLTIRAAAEQIGIHFTSLHKILRGHQRPLLPTLNAILDFARRYDPDVTFEDLFAEEPGETAVEAPERPATAAGGGRHA